MTVISKGPLVTSKLKGKQINNCESSPKPCMQSAIMNILKRVGIVFVAADCTCCRLYMQYLTRHATELIKIWFYSH